MKTKNFKSHLLAKTTTIPAKSMAIVAVLLWMSSCQQWGLSDPPAGNQVYPKLELLDAFTFEEDTLPASMEVFAYPSGMEPVLADDADLGSQVLQADEGYVRIANPLNAVKVQSGVSITCWVKLPATPDGESQDLTSAIFSFISDDETHRLFFTANGWLYYDGADGEYDENNPADVKTGMMTAGEWHYLAVSVTNEGYFVYVDGMRKIDKAITNADGEKMVQFMATVPYIYLGYGADNQATGISVDDLKIYRNTITAKETAMPGTGGGEESVPFIQIVGSTDMTIAFWKSFSNYLSEDGDCVFHTKFKNYTNGETNWNNWVLIVTNGLEREETDYYEYFALRADAWGWGPYHDASHITHNYDWTTFTEDMKGATVDLTLTRQGTHVEVTAITTTTSGATFEQKYYADGVPSGTIGAFFTVEGGYLEFDKQNISVGKLYPAGVKRIGTTDFATGFWTVLSDIVRTNGDFVVNYQFYNYTDQATNWDNWVLAVSNGLNYGETGYYEYFVLRADAWGWGDYFVTANMTNDYNWTTFTSDMHGAFVDLTLKMVGTRIEMTAITTTTGGVTYTYSYYHNDIPAGAVASFFTLEKAYIDFVSISTCPFINSKNAE